MAAGIEVYNQDVIDWSKEYKGEKFHALFTDCPYEYGFMDKSWDSSGISFSSDMWASLGEHLLPGAIGMTYGGARTWHRIAVAIENAGLIIHPSIFCWVYATGLHKGKHIDTVIDKENGVYEKRERLSKSTASYGYQKSGERWNKDHYVTKPYSEEALAWWNHRYGIQALRPAVEPVILFQKPYDGKKTDSMRRHGAGAFDIEACKYAGGKWPTNFIASHHPLCTKEQCHGSCNIRNGNFDADHFPTFDWELDMAENISVYYGKKSLGKERKILLDGINHPTVKPIAVNLWLAKLLLPPSIFTPRRILIPFSGVMSEAIAAALAGWEHVTGIEKNSDYASAGTARAEWWLSMAEKYGTNIEAIAGAHGSCVAGDGQLSMNIF